MAEVIFIVEDGTLTKFEADEHVEVVHIPDCVKRIGGEAFREASVGKVVIPYGVTVIEPDAFVDCGVEEIEIPDTSRPLKLGLSPAVKRFRRSQFREALLLSDHGLSGTKRITFTRGWTRSRSGIR